jgi:Cyclic nucleotide-binding domain
VDRTVARAEIFQTVEPSAVSGLTKHLHQVDFPRRQTVFAEGEPGDRLYIIISGKVKIGRRSPDGRDHLLTIMGAGHEGFLSTVTPNGRSGITLCSWCAGSSGDQKGQLGRPAAWRPRGARQPRALTVENQLI